MRRTRKICKKSYKHLHKYCFFCGEDDYDALHCHRIIPGEEGGTYHESNTLTACASCHAKVHSGRIKVDRKYQQMTSPLFKVHYWLDGEEFWRNEEIGMFTTDAECHHSGLGRSRKINKKRGGAQGTANNDNLGPDLDQGRGRQVRDDSLPASEKRETID